MPLSRNLDGCRIAWLTFRFPQLSRHFLRTGASRTHPDGTHRGSEPGWLEPELSVCLSLISLAKGVGPALGRGINNWASSNSCRDATHGLDPTPIQETACCLTVELTCRCTTCIPRKKG